MIAREDYRGPITKAALAMFARVDRQRGLVDAPAPPCGQKRLSASRRRGSASGSDAARALAEIGISRGRLRQWEELGLIELRSGPGRHRIVDSRVLEHLRLILRLRSAGFSLREIGYLSEEGPPTIEILRRRLARLQSERDPGQKSKFPLSQASRAQQACAVS